MKKKLIILLPVLLLAVGGGAYWFVLKPKPAPPVPKIAGAVVPLAEEFVVNLDGGHYGKISVALIVHGHAAAGGGHGGAEAGVAQEPAVRAVITDELTGIHQDELIRKKARHDVAERILKTLHKTTDVEVEEVLFTDITIQ